MKLSIKTITLSKESKACLIVGVYEGGQLTPSAKTLDKACDGALSSLLKQGVFQAKTGQTLPLFHPNDSQFSHIVLVGCGKSESVSATGYRRLVSSALKALAGTQTTQAICFLTDLDVKGKSLAWKTRQTAEVAKETLYRFDLFKSDKEPVSALKEFVIALPDSKAQKACTDALAQAEAIAEAVSFTKNLANTPSNICTPSFLADQAKALGKKYRSLSVTVLTEQQMQKLGMGALLGVSQGSAEEAKFIIVEYQGAGKKAAPVALVGKGVTFDTGGNSLKTPDGMVGMKYDMCGAATVLGTLQAAAELRLPVNVVGVIPSVENMPGGTAYKPEDILTSLSGQTIEVISTDAEGRLILADALTYVERYKPDTVIDIATLTGAVVIALGYHATGLLSNNDALAQDLLKAGEESHDRVWQLPLWEEYQEQIKSPFADMANTGGRAAGTITAACFLSRFAKKYHWAHLDVAGTAAMMGGTSERMATGRPVPLLVQYLINRANG